MSDLQKFNQTLEDFSQEVEQLKDVSGAYRKLERLTETYSEITRQFAENSKTLGTIIELQKVQQEKVSKSLVELEKTYAQNIATLTKIIDVKTDQIRWENKQFYKDLEGTIKIKLDENKSQIKQLIENERNQIKQIFEIEFAKNTKELKQVVETKISKQTQLLSNRQRTIKILIWIIGGLSLIVSALASYKLWI